MSTVKELEAKIARFKQRIRDGFWQKRHRSAGNPSGDLQMLRDRLRLAKITEKKENSNV
jgi:hypothetical protein